MLADKIAIIYGAGGAVGSTVAETFAREGVFHSSILTSASSWPPSYHMYDPIF